MSDKVNSSPLCGHCRPWSKCSSGMRCPKTSNRRETDCLRTKPRLPRSWSDGIRNTVRIRGWPFRGRKSTRSYGREAWRARSNARAPPDGPLSSSRDARTSQGRATVCTIRHRNGAAVLERGRTHYRPHRRGSPFRGLVSRTGSRPLDARPTVQVRSALPDTQCVGNHHPGSCSWPPPTRATGGAGRDADGGYFFSASSFACSSCNSASRRRVLMA